MNLARLAVAATLLGMLASACGGSGNDPLGAPAPCATATAAPTLSAGAAFGQAQSRQYSQAVIGGVGRLVSLYDAQRARYSSRSFSSDSAFRGDFAAYADGTVCLAQQIASIPAPDRFQPTQDALIKALNAYTEHTQFGRDAVRKRNVSEYHEWFDGVDARLQAVKEVASTLPTFTRPDPRQP